MTNDEVIFSGDMTLKEAFLEGFRKGSESKKEVPFTKYSIVRTYSAGVFLGIIAEQNGKEVTLKNARRLWYWKGAASLSQLSIDGVAYPDECKFPEAVSSVQLLEVIEILPVTEKAKKSIDSVKNWKV